MSWTQVYDPLGWWPLSTLVSALPVLTLFFVLLVLRKRVWVSALAGMLMVIGLAAAVFGMPAPLITAAALNGVVFGFFRIAWIIIASIYLYNVAVETGQFQVMKESIAGLSSDRRLQVILIALCFGPPSRRPTLSCGRSGMWRSWSGAADMVKTPRPPGTCGGDR